MKPEDQAWNALRRHASAQLRDGFADRVIESAHGAPAAAWQQLNRHAVKQIRPGFAERVMRAAREIKVPGPSLFGQFALGAATVAICFATVFVVHQRRVHVQEADSIASWEAFAAETQDADSTQ